MLRPVRNEAPLARDVCGLRPAGHVQLAEHRLQVGLDGPERDPEVARHGLVAQTDGNQAQDRGLAKGERRAAQARRKVLRRGVAQVAGSAGKTLHRQRHVVGAAVEAEVPFDTGRQRGKHLVFPLPAGDDEDPRRGRGAMGLLPLVRQRESVLVVDDDHIGAGEQRIGGGQADQVEVGSIGQHGLQAGGQERGRVRDTHADAGLLPIHGNSPDTKH